MKTFRLTLIAFCIVSVTGCASLQEEIRGKNPPDTAILIGDVPYQINTVKCAQIRGVDKNGALDCFDIDGNRNSGYTPVGAWRRNYLKEKMGMEWASPAHQNWLFYMFHGGGTEKAAQQIAGALQGVHANYMAAKSLNDTLNKSKDIDRQTAQMKLDGVAAYASGGMPAWQAHQNMVIQWHADNARYFLDQANKSQLSGPE